MYKLINANAISYYNGQASQEEILGMPCVYVDGLPNGFDGGHYDITCALELESEKEVIHQQILNEMHSLYRRKNADYGDSFAQLRKRYPNFVCMRLFDKLNRLDTLIQPGYEAQVTDEKLEDTLMDIANYAVMEILERRKERANVSD